MEEFMRRLMLVALAPLALVACGSDERPIIVNPPPAATAPAPPSTVVVPTQPQPQTPPVVIDRR
jgi:hypothetical protein